MWGLHVIIPCKYESIGCDVRKKRRDMPDHKQDDKLHLHMAIDTTLQLKKDLQSAVRANAEDLQSALRILQLSLKG